MKPRHKTYLRITKKMSVTNQIPFTSFILFNNKILSKTLVYNRTAAPTTRTARSRKKIYLKTEPQGLREQTNGEDPFALVLLTKKKKEVRATTQSTAKPRGARVLLLLLFIAHARTFCFRTAFGIVLYDLPIYACARIIYIYTHVYIYVEGYKAARTRRINTRRSAGLVK